MAYEPVPVDGLPVKLDRQTNKALLEAQRRAVAGQANTAAVETTVAYQTRQRIDNAYDLASRTVSNAILLNSQIHQAARGDAALEANLRINLEEPLMLGAGMLIARYMHRPT